MSFRPGDDEILYLPLGGTGEIGMNLNLYGHKGRWLMVDLGITFADHRLPGVDLLMPDPDFIEQQRENLVGLVLTHAHEDHIGAVAHLWPFLRCPIYATAFTQSMVAHKLAEQGLTGEVDVRVITVGGRFEVGPFDVEFLSMTHSVPEPVSLAIRTSAGIVFHSGDWKFDPAPVTDPVPDKGSLKALGEEGVLAMVSDSTNVMSEREAGSETSVRDALRDVIAGCQGRVAVTCFASNVARVDSVMRAADACGRRVLLMGRSMQRIYQAARDNGYLENVPPLLCEEEFEYLSPNQVVILCTGSQGEPRAATARLSRGEFRSVWLTDGDTIIFSSRVIPGNETAVFDLHNNFAARGVDVVTDRDAPVHVSGHPGCDDVRALYDLIRPQIAVPTHGEARHLREHARVATLSGVSQQITARNGDLIRFARNGTAERIEQVSAGTLALEGGRLVETKSAIFKDRQKMSHQGAAMVTLVLDEAGQFLGQPELSLHGLIEGSEESDIFEDAQTAVQKSLTRLSRGERKRDNMLKETARSAIRSYFNKLFRKKPVTAVHVVRV